MDVGERLKQARVEQGFYIPELVYRTHIRASLIEDIERNDFSNCGGDVYARGHVRALATALGLDPQPLLQAMGTEEPALVAEAGVPAEPEPLSIWELDKRSFSVSERGTRWVLAVLAVAIVGGLIWQAKARDTAAVLDNAVASTSPSASASPTPTPTPSASSPTPSATASSAVGTLDLQLSCTATAWVRVTNADGRLFEGTMHAGDTKTLTSRSDVTVRIGNAAGVTLVVGGQRYANLGAPGQVYDHTFAVG